MNGVSKKQMTELAEYIVGTCKSIDEAAETCGISDFDASDLEADLLHHDVERCVVCDWWCEVCELEWDDALAGGVCEDHRD